MKFDKLFAAELMSKVIRRIGLITGTAQFLIRFIIPKKNWRRRFNSFYNQTSSNEKMIIHTVAATAFRNKKTVFFEDFWLTDFMNTEIKLPLNSKNAWLNWDHAVSILGHDVEVKITYKTLLKSKYRPKVFFDIGANYGTHSLLFLSQNVLVTSFEPNPACVKEIEEFCRLNHFKKNVEIVALGDQEGVVDFWFPENDTWLGTVVTDTQKFISEKHNLNKIQVPQTTLDKYVEQSGLHPDLIKIDTEGNELSVIRGAVNTIKTHKPLIIFECDKQHQRDELFEIFRELNYSVCALPVTENLEFNILDLANFRSSRRNNFISLPDSHDAISQN